MVGPSGRSFGRSAFVRLAVAAFLGLIPAWLFVSHDPVRERIVGLILGDGTEYASGYSERALGRVARGQREADVRQVLGAPIEEDWFYAFDETQPCASVDLAQDIVVSTRDAEACLELGVDEGTARSSVLSTLGVPEQACWHYTRGRGQGYFRERRICFEHGKVSAVLRQWTSGGGRP